MNIPKRASKSRRLTIGKSNAFVLSLAIVTGISFSLFSVWSHTKVVNIGYEISQANTENKEIRQLNNKLKLEIATLKSPHYIERIAKRELNLRSPNPNQLVILQ